MGGRQPQLESGSEFPSYADVDELDARRMARVTRAAEIETSLPVALETLVVDRHQTPLAEVLDQEIRARSVVNQHPNVVASYRALPTVDGRVVILHEPCRGSLVQRVEREGPLSPQEAVSVGVKIAGALETTHRAGFLHRDVRPQNLLVSLLGEPALADFGVAALQTSAQSARRDFASTSLHAAPEVLEGDAPSAATDVYGLASSMYQLLTGRAPFAAFDGEGPAAVMLRILSRPVEPLHADDSPLALSDLLQASMAKDPATRPFTAETFANQLREIETACGWPATPFVVLEGDVPVVSPAVELDAALRMAAARAEQPTLTDDVWGEITMWAASTPAVDLDALPQRVEMASQRGHRSSLVMPVGSPRRVIMPVPQARGMAVTGRPAIPRWSPPPAR